jgi:hypothetical protein
MPARSRAHAALRALTDPRQAGGLLLASLLSLAFALWLYPAGMLTGQALFWHQENTDVTQYIAGFNAFVHEGWHWPLLRITSLNWPDGTLATFVDAIPLYALLLKLVRHGADTPFYNPYGFWIALCYLLQGTAAWWICREAQLKSWIALAAMACLLACFPALTFRIHHTSLMAHWLLLFGVALYIRSTRQRRLAAGGWCALVLAAFYINIYIFSMVSLLFAADWLRHFDRQRWRASLRAPLLTYALLGLTMLATMLPLTAGSGQREWGFGYYSMNLLSPTHGGRLLHWSAPQVHPGQDEGFNYIGLFVLAAFAYALALRARLDRAFWTRHRSLLLVLACLGAYALSNIVTIGPFTVLTLSLPDWTGAITGQLRVSGRFFWAVGYVLTVFSVLTIARLAAPRRVAVMLPLLVMLQWWDLRPLAEQTRRGTTLGESHIIDRARWDAFFDQPVDTLLLYPPFKCTATAPGVALLPTMLYAAQRQLKLSTAYVARVSKACDASAAEIASSPATAGFVFARADYPDRTAVERLLGGPAASVCIEADFAYLCKKVPQHVIDRTHP